jgi:hypothetical protein
MQRSCVSRLSNVTMPMLSCDERLKALLVPLKTALSMQSVRSTVAWECWEKRRDLEKRNGSHSLWR